MKSLTKWGRRNWRLVGTYFTLVLIVSGCTNQYDQVLMNGNDRTEITKAHSEFSSLAKTSDLPMKYVSEGKIGVSKVEAVLETADAADLHAQAQRDRSMADYDARRREVQAQVDRELSEADALRQKYSSEYGKAMAQIAAREAELGALIERKEAIVASLAKEGESQCNSIIANAREQFESESARIEQIRGIHNAIEVESNAKILQMSQASKATRQRAAATVSNFEAQAKATQLETEARVSELEEQIRSIEVKTASEAKRIAVARNSLAQDTAARVKELRSNAATVQANLASQEYELMLAQAQATKLSLQAITQEKQANVPTEFDRAMAEIGNLRAEIAHHQDSSVANYESVTAGIDAKLADELNEVKKLRVNSDRVEDIAHAEFVKSEASAVAIAVRETAAHSEAVAEAKKFEIIAAAEAEAARIKQEVLDEIANQKKAGKIEFANKTNLSEPIDEELHQVPEAPSVEPVAPRIEPDHIAAYRSSLAEVMGVRAKADALELVANATFAEEKTKMLAVKTQEEAIATEKLAVADALEAQARTKYTELETKLAMEMDVLESQYRQQVVAAESYRKEKEAQVIDLQAQAAALEDTTNARVAQLLVEEETVLNCGANTKEELEVELWATQQKGGAEFARFMSEAKSVLDSQEALALEIDAQVASATKHLAAELAKIDNSITSSVDIANADYQQAMTQSAVLAQNTEAQINRTNAQFAMEHTIANTQIARDRQLALSQHLRSEAACDRMVANANTNRVCENADIDAMYASADADLNIVLTSNAAKRDSAQAHLEAVKARFAARVEQVKAERVILMADEHNALALKRTDLASALAQAVAAREDSSIKLDALAKKQAELQRASMVNWSQKLAEVKSEGFEFKVYDSNIPATQMVDFPSISDPKATLTRNLDL